ncbi:MAG: FxsA family protein [Candidatus Nanosalina sp.]
MLGLILLLAISVPFIDLYLLVQLSQMIGFWQVLGIILLTGIVGAEVVRREGIYVFRKIQRSVTAGEVSRNMLEVGLLVGGGFLLLLPGLITDITGITIIIRPIRERIAAKVTGNSSGFVEIEFHTF